MKNIESGGGRSVAKMILILTCMMLGIQFVFTSAANALSSDEKKLIDGIEAHFTSIGKEFLKNTVNINSGTLNREGVLAVAELYEQKLKEIGFSTTRIDLKNVARGCHLFAEHKGSPKSPRLLLIGHMDTVFEKENRFQTLEIFPDGKLKGPGVADMKGGNLVIIESLEALKRSGHLAEMNIQVALIGDEEFIGRDSDGTYTTSRTPLIQLAQQSDYALGFEPASNAYGKIVTARRGNSGWGLKISAKPGHSSNIFSKKKGPGAIFAIARVIDQFYKELRRQKYLSFNIGNVAGGSNVERPGQFSFTEAKVNGKTNIIAATAEAVGDIRTLSEEQLTATRAKMKAILARELVNLNKDYSKEVWVTGEIVFRNGYPAMPPTPGNQRLLKLFSQASQDLNEKPLFAEDPATQGAADIAFAANYVKGAVDGLGPAGSEVHTDGEHTYENNFVPSIELATLMLHRLSTKPMDHLNSK